MSEVKIVEAEPAIGFNCGKCDHYNYENDCLERDDDYEGQAIDSDMIQCEKCGEDNKVIRYL